VISYTTEVKDLTEDQLDGFFAGWPRSPSFQQFHAALHGSYRALVATDEHTGSVVGFITAISDGTLTAFIPWLEVLPTYQGHGIGSELLDRTLTELGTLYSVDLTCEENLTEFYVHRGMIPLRGMATRNPAALANPAG